ncbi:hypothetical protein WG922_21865 [Ramlibacter sp. AN1015]|uniref:hypothetical protein n=1 Tax=Ramlibacter sp. AN1015 TaxID=3133428 RepID=UPI0030C1EBE0
MKSPLKLRVEPRKKIEVDGERQVTRKISVIDNDRNIVEPYDLMCACLDSDVQTVEGSGALFMHWLRKIEAGEVGFIDFGGNGWTVNANRDKVWFEGLYSQGEGGEVSFAQFKFALETYLKYLADPQHKPIEVEFPDH